MDVVRLGGLWVIAGLLLCVGPAGCRSDKGRFVAAPAGTAEDQPLATIEPVGFESIPNDLPLPDELPEPLPGVSADEPELILPERVAVGTQAPLTLDEVVASVRNYFPLIQQAAASRGIAAGEVLSAEGAFDHKLEGFSETQPLDFYENSRHSVGVKRDTIWGGQTFAQYRIGRGSFEPWYLERETNKGGEFKAGLVAPLVRDRQIDANRAALWQAQLERRRVEPEIMAQVILFVRDGAVAYWNWVAAGRDYLIASELLKLANERNEALEEQVRVQEKAEIELVDNRRIIVSREAKLIEGRRKLEQAAVKLSLYFRLPNGEPAVAGRQQLPDGFPTVNISDETNRLAEESSDARLALRQRPELAELQAQRQQLSVALRQAVNETWPNIDGGILVAQDVGEPTSSKRDKSEFELEALLTISVPLERRKAVGKVRSLRSKLAQLNAKNRFQADKIVADVRLARAALIAALERIEVAVEGFQLAQQMREAEQELFNQGQSTLLNLYFREQQAAEAAATQVQAYFDYFVARADYAAALGYDAPVR